MSKNSITILESQFNSINAIKSIKTKWKIIETYAYLQLGIIPMNDIENIEDDIVKSHIIQFKFYLEKRDQNKKNGSLGGKKTQSNNKAMLEQCSTDNKGNLKQYKYKNKYKTKELNNLYKPPKYEELLSYGKANNIPQNNIDSFYKYYESCDWLDRKNNPIDWQNKLIWWNSQNQKKDSLPIYSTENNVVMSKEEEEELLILMGKGNKLNEERC